MQKYRCYYTNDFRDDYDAMAKQDEHGEWYRVDDVDARITELEKALRSCVAAIDSTYESDDSRGLPFKLYDAAEAARTLMDTKHE